mgnify:CR=1 FL=1
MFGFTKRPLFLIAWKNLKTYPVRIFLTTSSIILGVAVIIASNIFSESNKSAFDNLFSGIYEGVDLVVQPIQEDFAEGFSGDGGQGPISFEVKKIPDERIEEISNLPSVKAAWGEVLGFAQFIKIVDGETVLISNGFAPTFGAAWDSNPYAAQWSLVEGDPPTNTKEVVMDVVTAENHDFTVGDRVTVLAGATPASFTIVGIAEFANVGAPGGATFALFEFRTAQKLLDSRGEVDLINVVIENNFDINDVKTQITNLDSENLNVINAQEAAAEQADSIKQGLDFFNTILNVFAGIAIFVGAFIIQNTFRILLLQRTKELSLLRALGTSKRQIYRLVISESLFMSVIGSGLGIALGIGFIGAMVIIRPGFQQVSLGQLAQLLASPIFAASYLMAKRLSFKESSLVIVGMLSLFVSMAQIPMVLVVWQTPELFDVICLGLVAILATTGHYAMTQSFRLTPMTISQPVTYLQLVWASIMGIYLFGDRFDIFVILGGAMITLSATVIAYLDTRAPKDAI